MFINCFKKYLIEDEVVLCGVVVHFHVFVDPSDEREALASDGGGRGFAFGDVEAARVSPTPRARQVRHVLVHIDGAKQNLTDYQPIIRSQIVFAGLGDLKTD